MGDVTKFAALNTKIRVLERELLKISDYEALLNSDSLDQGILYLVEKTDYSEIFDKERALTLQSIEELLYRNLLNKYDKITCFLHPDYKKIFKNIFLRYEVEHIKGYIRKLNRGEAVKNLYKKFEGAKYSDLEYYTLSQSDNLSDFIQRLSGTDYYKILSYHLDDDNPLFYMEMRLDLYYFNKLNRSLKKMFGQSKKNTILEVLQKNSDLLNIQWIYRGKTYYNFTSEEILNYVLLTGYYFKYKDLKKLCYAKTPEALVKMIEKSKYGFLFKERENFEFLMERNVERYIYNLFKNIEKISHLNINKSISYMHKLEYEMRDIFTILESVKYNLDPGHIKTLLVRDLEGGSHVY